MSALINLIKAIFKALFGKSTPKNPSSTQPTEQQTPGLLADWAGFANTNIIIYQVSNLSNAGLILEHNLNTGVTLVKNTKWTQLTNEEHQTFRRIMQAYQNENNSQLEVEIITVDSLPKQG